jgi:hypothetical protein
VIVRATKTTAIATIEVLLAIPLVRNISSGNRLGINKRGTHFIKNKMNIF